MGKVRGCMKPLSCRCSLKVIRTLTTYAALLAGTAAMPAIAQTEIKTQAANSDPSGNSTANPSSSVTTSDKMNAEILRELQQMRARIAELEAQLKAQQGPSATAAVDGESSSRTAATVANPSPSVASKEQTQAAPTKPEPEAPFSYADWTWLNGNARTKHSVWDSKFFTPEIRFDANYI